MPISVNDIPKTGITVVNEYSIEQSQNGNLRQVKRTKTYGSVSDPKIAKAIQDLAKIHISL